MTFLARELIHQLDRSKNLEDIVFKTTERMNMEKEAFSKYPGRIINLQAQVDKLERNAQQHNQDSKLLQEQQ